LLSDLLPVLVEGFRQVDIRLLALDSGSASDLVATAMIST